MKKLLVLSLVLLGVSIGCQSQAQSWATVQKAFPDCEIRSVPDQSDAYVIRKPNGQVEYVMAYPGGCGTPVKLLDANK